MVKSVAGSLLDDMVSSHQKGGGFKAVLDDIYRWQTPKPIEMQDLEPQLSNTDLALAVPVAANMTSSLDWKWAALQAARCKRLLDSRSATEAAIPGMALLNRALADCYSYLGPDQWSQRVLHCWYLTALASAVS